MDLVFYLLIGFPLGYFLRNRLAAYVALIAVHSFLAQFMAIVLVREWVGHDTSAFPADPKSAPWAYGVTALVAYALAFLLVEVGHRVGTRRRTREQAIDLSAARP